MYINTAAYGILNPRHIKKIKTTLDKSTEEYPRTLLVRVDLFVPDKSYNNDSGLITRFHESLKAQIEADMLGRGKMGKRVHLCKVRFVWAREFHECGRKHYHVALFLNKDTYAYPGTYRPSEQGTYIHNLAFMIMEAWARTLKRNCEKESEQYYPNINFPTPCYMHLNRNSRYYEYEYKKALDWINYLAKEYSKDYTDGQRNFGSSQY